MCLFLTSYQLKFFQLQKRVFSLLRLLQLSELELPGTSSGYSVIILLKGAALSQQINTAWSWCWRWCVVRAIWVLSFFPHEHSYRRAFLAPFSCSSFHSLLSPYSINSFIHLSYDFRIDIRWRSQAETEAPAHSAQSIARMILLFGNSIGQYLHNHPETSLWPKYLYRLGTLPQMG